MCFSHRWSGSSQSAHSVPSHEPHVPGSIFLRFHDQTCNPQCSLASRRPQKQRKSHGDRTARVLVVGPLCDLTAEPQGHLWKRGPVGIGVSVLKYLELGKKQPGPSSSYSLRAGGFMRLFGGCQMSQLIVPTHTAPATRRFHRPPE